MSIILVIHQPQGKGRVLFTLSGVVVFLQVLFANACIEIYYC